MSESTACARGVSSGAKVEWCVFALIVLGGSWLRYWQLGDQVLMDDEYHAVYEILRRSYLHIATHLYFNDPFIPLTLAYKLLADTVGLDETNLRLLQLVCGALTVAVLPLLARPVLRRGEFLTFATLLAISPQLIHYSRWARPYSIVTFLCTIAFVAFVAFFRHRRRRYAIAYEASSVLAVYFQPIALPFVLAPPLFAASTLLVRHSAPIGARLWQITKPAVMVVGALSVLFAAPLVNSVREVSSYSEALSGLDPNYTARGAGTAAGIAAWLSNLPSAAWTSLKHNALAQVAMGVKFAWLAMGMLLATVLGCVLFARREAWLTGCLVTTAIFQIIAVAVSSPVSLQFVGVFLRYNLWVLPIVLFFCCVGLNACSPIRFGWAVPIAVLGTIALASPLPEIYWKPNNFMNAPSFQLAFTHSAVRSWLADVDQRTPGFYRLLAKEKPGGLIVETPWLMVNLSVINGQLQSIHRQRVAIGLLDEGGPGSLPLRDSRLHFRNFVQATDLAEMQQRGARYLIVHKRLRKEVALLLPWQMPNGDPEEPPLEKYLAIWRTMLGDPIYEDEWIRVHAIPAA